MRVRVRPAGGFRSHWWRPFHAPRAVGLLLALSYFLTGSVAPAAAQDIVLHTADVTNIQGNWSAVDSASAAGMRKMTSADWGWATTDTPQAHPGNYFEASFSAQAWTTYRVWLRLRATGDSKWNDSVWVQFSDSIDPHGNALYRTGTGSALLFNLELCGDCGVGGWGWSGAAWWLDQQLGIQFPSAGTKTIRIQTREDGVEIDQIVLSPSTYLYWPPGQPSWDGTILSRDSGGGSTTPSAPPSPSAMAIPGLIGAADFDGGVNGVAYYDTSAGNSGGRYRSTDVDIEDCAEGGHNIGWTASGEWLNYTVNVASSGSYTVALRVASTRGGTVRVEFNGANLTGSMHVPVTGAWQAWTSVSTTVNLSAGPQLMRVVFETGSTNLSSINLTAGSGGGGGSPSPAAGPYGGAPWGIPGTIQSEDFDHGGQWAAYHDQTSGNEGGAYRATDVDIQAAGSGHTVGWVGAGEWLQYTVNVTASSPYTLTARVASAGDGGTFHVEFNGADKTGQLRVPSTGGWGAFQDVTVTVWLDAGVQTMRLAFDSTGWSGAVGNFDYVRLTQESAPAPAPAPAPEPAPAPSTPGGGRIRVMTWNIAFGWGNPWGQAQEIANSGADVALLQEASTFDEYMPSTYAQRLQQLTGQTWQAVWAPHGGRYTDNEGTLILTRFPVVAQSTMNAYDRGFSRVTVDVGGVHVHLFSAHLDWDTGLRSAQLDSFMAWMRQFGGPTIAGGDFNSWWGEYWVRQMETEFSDTWRDVTGSPENGYTLNGSVRFDYLFRAYRDNWRLTPTACWVPWTGASDHLPVVADYSVR